MLQALSTLGVVTTLLFAGCSLQTSMQQPVVPGLVAYQQALAQRFETGQLPPEAYDDKHERNRVIDEMLVLVDQQFFDYELSLYNSNAVVNTIADAVTVGAGAGAALATGGTSQVLGAVTAMITGTRASFDKNFFAEQSRIALIVKMNALRAGVLEEIQTSKDQPVSSYSMASAMLDVQRYAQAGTVLAALQAIAEDSGAELKASRSRMMGMRRTQQ